MIVSLFLPIKEQYALIGKETTMAETRIEKDSMGELAVPVDALYGAQTQRAIELPISGQAMPEAFVRALITIKAAARANQKLGVLDDTRAQAIIDGCDSLLSNANIMKHFPVDVFQTGSVRALT